MLSREGKTRYLIPAVLATAVLAAPGTALAEPADAAGVDAVPSQLDPDRGTPAAPRATDGVVGIADLLPQTVTKVAGSAAPDDTEADDGEALPATGPRLLISLLAGAVVAAVGGTILVTTQRRRILAMRD